MAAAARRNKASRPSSYRYARFAAGRLLLRVRAYSPFITLILPLVGILGYLYLDILAAPDNRMGVFRWRVPPDKTILFCALAVIGWLGLLLRRSEKTVIDFTAGVVYKRYWFLQWKQAEASDITGFIRLKQDDAMYGSIYSLPLAVLIRPSSLAHYATTSPRSAARIRLTPDLPLGGRDLTLFEERILPLISDMIAVRSAPDEEDGGDNPVSPHLRGGSRQQTIRELLDDD